MSCHSRVSRSVQRSWSWQLDRVSLSAMWPVDPFFTVTFPVTKSSTVSLICIKPQQMWLRCLHHAIQALGGLITHNCYHVVHARRKTVFGAIMLVPYHVPQGVQREVQLLSGRFRRLHDYKRWHLWIGLRGIWVIRRTAPHRDGTVERFSSEGVGALCTDGLWPMACGPKP